MGGHFGRRGQLLGLTEAGHIDGDDSVMLGQCRNVLEPPLPAGGHAMQQNKSRPCAVVEVAHLQVVDWAIRD